MPSIADILGVTGDNALGAIKDVLVADRNADATAAGYRAQAQLSGNSSAFIQGMQQQTLLYVGIGGLAILAAAVLIWRK